MTTSDDEFNRKKVCYEQNFQQLRSLNDQMNRIPTVATTLTGGLWYGASLTQNVDSHLRFGLLILAGIFDLALILACTRIRDVLQSYLEQVRAFDPDSFASGRPERPVLGRFGNYSMIGVYSALMGTAAAASFFGAFVFYWTFSLSWIWGAIALAAILSVVFWFLTSASTYEMNR